MKSKKAIRADLRAIRSEITFAEVVTKSGHIVAALDAVLKSLSFKSLHCYEPISKLHEVDVSELFDMPDIALYTSRKQADEWHIVSMLDDIAKEDVALDVIIVPMLGFDENLHRIGYGGGYYDRLLAAHPRALRIGVCYESGKVEQIPIEPHDIPLNLIITEERAVIAI